MSERTIGDLRQKQALPLNAKIAMTKARIREWYEYWEGDVYVSFSGGKDSTVLLHLVREMYPDVPAVFVNTGLEWPEIREFVKTFENVITLTPKMTFRQVVERYGYPVVSKDVSNTVYYAKKGSAWANERLDGVNPDGSENDFRATHYAQWKKLKSAPFDCANKCCILIKEKSLNGIKSKPYIGTLAEESKLRKIGWLKTGCNAFDGKRPHSMPMSFWTEQDVLHYIKRENIQIASVYGDIAKKRDKKQLDGQINLIDYLGAYEEDDLLETTGMDRTGCMFCMFGAQCEKSPTRFERMKITHPRLYEYCINGGTEDENGKWIPDNHGLGLGRILDYLGIKY